MKIVILGNGIAGTNAARHIRKRSDHEILMISDETLRPFSRTALMYVFMGHLRQENTELYEDRFWEKNRIGRLQARVERIDFQSKTLHLAGGATENYDRLILAVGSISNKFGWPGQDLRGVQGLYHLQDLQKMEAAAQAGLRRAVIVGGGLIGIEMAEMCHSRGIAVTFLVRETSFWNPVLPPEESAMVNRHILENHIDLRLETELKEVIGDENGQAVAVITNLGERIECGLVGLTVGVRPNIDFLKNSGLEIGRGVLVDEFLRTSEPHVFAIGDCAEIRNPQPGRRPIEAIWYTGRMMGQTVAENVIADYGLRITDLPKTSPHSIFCIPYSPRLWFNSAKFFDIEYQIYGDVPARTPEHVTSIYWEHEGGKKAIRLNFHRETGAILGFHLMGIRYRHEVCERWILEKTPVETVLQNLGLANFDPEFFAEYEADLLAEYNRQSGRGLVLKTRRGLPQVLSFLKNH